MHPRQKRTTGPLWTVWVFTILAVPWYPAWHAFVNPEPSGKWCLLAYLVILAVSLVLAKRWAESRRGSWEWFVEIMERGVPLSLLGAVIAAVLGFAGTVAMLFSLFRGGHS